jgi:hypothetical protein
MGNGVSGKLEKVVDLLLSAKESSVIAELIRQLPNQLPVAFSVAFRSKAKCST